MPYKDPDKDQEVHKAWTETHKAHLAAYARKRRAKDPEKLRAQAHARYRKNHTKIRAQARARYQLRQKEYAENRRTYRQNNLAKLQEQERQRSAAERHKYGAEINAKARARRAQHREEYRIKDRVRHARDAARRNARSRMFYATHTVIIAQRNKTYNLAHPEVQQAHEARRRAQKKTAINTLSAAQWREIKAAYGHRCVYCGQKPKQLTQDHLAHQGEHAARNIVPACRSCNSKKNAGPVLKPVQPLLLTVAPPQTPKHLFRPEI
jgi:hypothetical protein